VHDAVPYGLRRLVRVDRTRGVAFDEVELQARRACIDCEDADNEMLRRRLGGADQKRLER
jgi:hypothetical protein